MHNAARLAQVVPDIPVSGIAESYTYLVPDGMSVAPGDAVLVPFAGRTVAGFLTSEPPPSVLDFEPKPIQSHITGLSLPKPLVELIEFVHTEYIAPRGACYGVAMPPGVRTRLSTAYEAVPGANVSSLPPAQRETYHYVAERGKITERTLIARKQFVRNTVRALVKAGVLAKIVELPEERRQTPKALTLSSFEEAEKFMSLHAKRRPAQCLVLQTLLSAPPVGMSQSEIAALAGVSEAVVAKLVSDGLLVGIKEETRREAYAPRKLTGEQSYAVGLITEAIRSAASKKFLLYGVTGSGKTEVYMRAVAETLALGKTSLYLVPEIALTAQVVGQLRERFGPRLAVMHSGLPEGERLRHWRRIRSGDAPVVVGARSAVFAPLENIGLIVMDEEHEGSYKQDSTPRYHTRTLVEKLAGQHNAVLVLGSATPSVETYYRANRSEFEMLELSQRAQANAELPKVVVTDLREAFKSGQPAILGPDLKPEMEAALERKEQTILFINRRAFAHSLLCRECGNVPKCKNCSVSLTFHKRAARLVCHQCGTWEPAPDTCANCGAIKLRPLGLGTERVEAQVRQEFPNARVARLDRDTARRKGWVEEVLSGLRNGELDIVVGTQMIAKGLDFPNVTLVGVIAADIGLSLPDFRSTERTFQLLTQVAGRSGRAKAGKVVIQTFQPEHPAIRFASAQDYADFYSEEIKEREEALYPPYVRIVNVIAQSESQSEAAEAIRKIAEELSKLPKAEVVGPAECALARLHGKWRRHLILKAPYGVPIQLPELPRFPDVQVIVDVDPASML